MSFRTEETEEAYRAYRANEGAHEACPLCAREPKATFTYWRIIENLFPYDRIAVVHDLLLPNRHVTEVALTSEEQDEFMTIKSTYVNEQYGYLLEPTPARKTVPAHHHIHLITSKFD